MLYKVRLHSITRPMKVLIACDKFKGSLSAIEVCRAIALGMQQQDEGVDIRIQPLADGGDGTMVLLRDILGLETYHVDTIDPLGRAIQAEYYANDQQAFIELAEASGITRLLKTELDPMKAHTLGTGALIADALQRGYTEIILGLGGSCTNDAGLGIAHALGYRFVDTGGVKIIPSGGTLQDMSRIIAPADELQIKLTLLCDVKNPLYGPNGAAHTYAAQKGASPAQIVQLDQGLQHVAELIKDHIGIDISRVQGGGAAGGIAAGLIGLYGATSQSGFDYIRELTELENKIKSSDLVITGEGRLDDQSIQGKVVGRLADLCQAYEKPLVVVGGDSVIDSHSAKEKGIHKVHTIMDRADGIDDAMQHTAQYLIEIGREIVV